MSAARFVLYSRPGCGLCEEMLSELGLIPEAGRFAVDVINVDTDRAAQVRYGHKIPVLLFDGEPVCHGRLEPEEVYKALAQHG